MKQDQLEQFIQANRQEFDQALPSTAVWDKIAADLPKEETKVISLKRILSMAASVIILIGMGVMIGLQLAPKHHSTIADIAPEFQEVEQFYANKVNYQLHELAQYSISDDPLIQEDLAELDQWMKQLHTELLEVPNNQKEAVINAIIKNYKTKLSILEGAIIHAKEHKQIEDNSSPKKSI